MNDQLGNPTRCGMVAIMGRPNVGKSTLMNRLLGRKISITSRKPQTTRYHILGVDTQDAAQLVFIDTPGLQKHPSRALGRATNKEALRALAGVDIVLFLVDSHGFNPRDAHVLKSIEQASCPQLMVIINKIDKLGDKTALLPIMAALGERIPDAVIYPVSAKTGNGVAELATTMRDLIPESAHLFPGDQVTDRSMRFLAGEIIREKLMRHLGDELPYSTSVIVDSFAEQKRMVHIDATIWVERGGQKAIVIGKHGATLKKIGERARVDLESLVDAQVFLRTWVKVKENWADSARALCQLGFGGH